MRDTTRTWKATGGSDTDKTGLLPDFVIMENLLSVDELTHFTQITHF